MKDDNTTDYQLQCFFGSKHYSKCCLIITTQFTSRQTYECDGMGRTVSNLHNLFSLAWRYIKLIQTYIASTVVKLTGWTETASNHDEDGPAEHPGCLRKVQFQSLRLLFAKVHCILIHAKKRGAYDVFFNNYMEPSSTLLEQLHLRVGTRDRLLNKTSHHIQMWMLTITIIATVEFSDDTQSSTTLLF